MKLILFALISFAWSSQVIPIHKYLTNKTCTQQLKAKILPFTSGDPEYQTSEGFLKSMKESSPNELYFFSHSPEFSRRSDIRWRMIPDLNGHDSLYILKVLVHESEVSDGYRIKNDWSNSDLRSLGRLITFTRIRISPFFGVLKSAIEHVRGLESHNRQESYTPPLLLSEIAVDSGNDRKKLVDYVNSWIPQTENEIIIKEFIKDFLIHQMDSFEEKRAIDLFRESFSDELRRLYPFASRL